MGKEVLEKHCAVAKIDACGNDKFLIWNNENDFKWLDVCYTDITEVRDRVTLFTPDEAQEIADFLNDMPADKQGLGGAYVQVYTYTLIVPENAEKPKFKMGEEVFVLSTNSTLYNSICYGAYLGKIKEIKWDYVYRTFEKYPDKKDWFFNTDNNPFVNLLNKDRLIMTKKELIEKGADFNTSYGCGYFRYNKMLFKIID